MTPLKRNLGVLGAIAISLAVMGPSMSVSLNPQAIAEQVGSAVPTTYLLAMIPLMLITVSFVLLSRRRGSAGSLYGFVGAEIGSRSGVAAGLWLVLAYVAAVAITALSFGIFVTTFLQEFWGVATPSWLPVVFALAILPITAFIATRTMKTLGGLLLALEGLTMGAILYVVIAALVKLINGGGPQGQTVEWSDFRFEGIGLGALAIALTFALLSSAGFEGAASAGEEADNPRRTIPVAIVITALLSSVFFMFVTMVAVWAFGTSPSELEQFTASGSLPADIANAYVGDAMGDLITLGGAVSSFACMIGAQVAGGRILYAFGRDAVIPKRFGRLSGAGTPVNGSVGVGVLGFVFTLFAVVVTAFDAFSAFELTSDTAGIVFAGAYAAACAAAGVVMVRGGAGRVWAVIPGVGVVVLIIVLLLQLFPLPSGWELIAPAVGVIALVAGAAVGRTRGHRAANTF